MYQIVGLELSECDEEKLHKYQSGNQKPYFEDGQWHDRKKGTEKAE
jgi:hypothetical protein